MTSTTEGSTTTAYEYDGVGKRLEATTGAQTTAYTWDPNAGLPELVRESDGAGALLRRYTYGLDLLTLTDGTGTFSYHHDLLGSAVGITTAAGVEAARYAYEPYGEGRTARPVLPTIPPVSAPANPMRFTGEYLDAQSELYHLRARDYDSTSGRFAQIDPLAQSITDARTGTYAYVGGRPTLFVDPSGMRGTQRECRNLVNASTTDYLLGWACPPEGFEARFGYKPVLINTENGWRFLRPSWANGGCSSILPDHGPYWDATWPCQTHDYAYDLKRLGLADRAEADGLLLDDLQNNCSREPGLARLSCGAIANLAYSSLRVADFLQVPP